VLDNEGPHFKTQVSREIHLNTASDNAQELSDASHGRHRASEGPTPILFMVPVLQVAQAAFADAAWLHQNPHYRSRGSVVRFLSLLETSKIPISAGMALC
jgi:hypothetical protein